MGGGSIWDRSGCKAHDSWDFSSIETDKTCRQVHKRCNQVKFLFDDGDQHIGGHGTLDLRLHRVLAGGQKSLDAQVLLDPLEEQLNLPTALVQSGDGQRWQCHIVGQKHQRLTRLRVFEFHPTSVHAALTAGNEERAALVKLEQPSKIQIAPVRDLKSARLDRQDIEHLDIAQFAIADMAESGDGHSQIQQRMHLHGGLGGAKRRPIEQTQTQDDGRGVQRVDTGIQVDARGLFDADAKDGSDSAVLNTKIAHGVQA